MNIVVKVKTVNNFHAGWLACVLGLPREHPEAGTMKLIDHATFQEGWDMCYETGSEAILALPGMAKAGQVTVCWAEEPSP